MSASLFRCRSGSKLPKWVVPVQRVVFASWRESSHTAHTGGTMARDWMIEGKYIEYCSCDLGCPCESMADPTQGYCTGAVAFKIDKGHCDAVPLDGISVVATFYF